MNVLAQMIAGQKHEELGSTSSDMIHAYWLKNLAAQIAPNRLTSTKLFCICLLSSTGSSAKTSE